MIPMDTIKVFSETAHDQLIDSRDAIHEAQIDSEIIHAIVTNAHAHQVVLAPEIYVHDGIINIHELTHPYAKCHVSDVAVHNTPLQTVNALYHWNKSRTT